MKHTILVLLFLSAAANSPGSGPYDYTSQLSWGGDCTPGHTKQSPINIPFPETLKLTDNKIVKVNYKATKFTVQNSGNSIGADFSSDSPNSLDFSFEGKVSTYNLAGFHFHTPSEHRFGGKLRSMEMHMVHKTEDKTAKNQYLVVSTTFVLGGYDFPFFEDLFAKAIVRDLGEIQAFKDVTDADLSQFVSEKNKFYFYEGSTTTPPCVESVNWLIRMEPLEISFPQLLTMKQWLSEIYPYGNNRVVQHPFGREVFISAPK